MADDANAGRSTVDTMSVATTQPNASVSGSWSGARTLTRESPTPMPP